MQRILTQIVIFALKFGVIFTPQEKYQQKVSATPSMETKNKGYDLRGWSYHSIRSNTTGEQYWYYRYGNDSSKTPLICVHGLLLDGRTYLRCGLHLKDRPVISLNTPEKSSLYTGNMDDYVKMLTDFLHALNIQECLLMGTSFGGVMALHCAANMSNDIDINRLILAASPIAGATQKSRKNAKDNYKWIHSQPDYRLYWFMEKLNSFSANSYENSENKEFTRIFQVKHPDYYRQLSSALAGYSGMPAADSVQCPVLVLHADGDILLDDKMRDLMKNVFADVTYKPIENAKHTMVFTKPRTIAKHINDFTTR